MVKNILIPLLFCASVSGAVLSLVLHHDSRERMLHFLCGLWILWILSSPLTDLSALFQTFCLPALQEKEEPTETPRADAVFRDRYCALLSDALSADIVKTLSENFSFDPSQLSVEVVVAEDPENGMFYLREAVLSLSDYVSLQPAQAMQSLIEEKYGCKSSVHYENE